MGELLAVMVPALMFRTPGPPLLPNPNALAVAPTTNHWQALFVPVLLTVKLLSITALFPEPGTDTNDQLFEFSQVLSPLPLLNRSTCP
jgi:hypothetical protein